MNNTDLDTAYFFDIHRHPHKHTKLELSLEAFLEASRNGQLFDSEPTETATPVIPDAKSITSINTTSWIDLQILLVWTLTGKIADKETIYPYRDVFQALLKRYGLRSSFRLNVVCAYLICAVRLKRNGWSAEDKNNVDDFQEFCSRLLDPRKNVINGSTFMCAHREANETDANKLVPKLKSESFVRVVNILRGIVYNLENKQLLLTVYHLNQSKYSLLAIFPNIILKYLEQEGLDKLLTSIGEHYMEIDGLIKELSCDRLRLSLFPTEKHIINTRRLCEDLGGADWRTLTPLKGQQSLPDMILHEIAEEAAMDEVERYMPEYGNIISGGTLTQKALQTKNAELVGWYEEQENLTPYAKALYETIFYYNWGRILSDSDGIGIGIDRDHSDFQVRAFHAGYNKAYEFGSRAPIVYLRRSEREVGKSDVHSLSLRQFWRYSTDHIR